MDIEFISHDAVSNSIPSQTSTVIGSVFFNKYLDSQYIKI